MYGVVKLFKQVVKKNPDQTEVGPGLQCLFVNQIEKRIQIR